MGQIIGLEALPVKRRPRRSATSSCTGGHFWECGRLAPDVAIVAPATPTVVTTGDGRLRLDIPANAFLQDGGVVTQTLTIRLQPATLPATATPTATPTGTAPAGAASPTPVLEPLFAFRVDALLTTSTGETAVTQLAQPLTITVSYDPEEVRAHRLDEATLQIWVVAEPSGVLEALPTTVDLVRHTLTAVLPHLSYYVVRGQFVPYRAYVPIWKLGQQWSYQSQGW